MSRQILFVALLFVSVEASQKAHQMRGYHHGYHSWAYYSNIAEPDPESDEYIPVDGSGKSDPVKAFKYRSPPVSAPDQGFEGGDVAHSHMETTTGDWGAEYGPEAWWLHKPKSGTISNFISTALMTVLLLVVN